MVLAAGNVEYEDVRIAREQWAELKESKEKKRAAAHKVLLFFFFIETPEGKLPTFETDGGVVLSQSQAIAAYAAELGGN